MNVSAAPRTLVGGNERLYHLGVHFHPIQPAKSFTERGLCPLQPDNAHAESGMNKLRKIRKQAAENAYRQQPLHPFLAGVSDDEPFWRDLPDILQSQVMVMLDNGRPTKKNPTPREPEKLRWAGTPHTRKRTVLLIILIWALFLAVPAIILEDLVDEIGGWLALAWAVVTVFIFVPRLTRGNREVFALTSRRAFVSRRTMYCSIHTDKILYSDIAKAQLLPHKDGTATIVLTKTKVMYMPVERITFDRIRDVRGAERVLGLMLPTEVAQEAGFPLGDER